MKKFLAMALVVALLIATTDAFCFADKKEDGIMLSFVGDMMFDQSVGAYIKAKGADYVFEGYDPYFQKSDIVMGNLETSLSSRGEPVKDKEFTFRSDPKMAAALKKHNFTVVSIANNHVLDYGRQSFLDTMKNLGQNGIFYAGGGKNRQEAENAAIVEKNGIKTGFVAFTKVVPSVDWYAGKNTPGIIGAYKAHEESVIGTIKANRGKCDILVVAVHWGKEGSNQIRKEERELAHKMIDAGADIIVGHHPHVVQGIEMYKQKPIFYSMGNFIFTNSSYDLCNKTIMAQVNIDGEKKIGKIDIIPGILKAGKPSPMDAKQRGEFVKYLNRLNTNFKI